MGSVVAFIPVRGGSKSIPKKNIKPIAGKPLVQWTVEAASNCKHINEVFVATDSEEIKAVVESLELPNVTVIGRSASTASDTASTESALLEFATSKNFESVVLIQATSPLLTSDHLSEGISLHLESSKESVLSAVRQKRFIWTENGNEVLPQNYDLYNRPRRQEFEGFLVENGAFYITTRDDLLKSRNRISGKIHAYEMPEESYFELDEPSDWVIIEQLLKRNSFKKSLPTKAIKLFITDVDGVLTDAGMYYGNDGNELKKFHTRDGKGLELLRAKGIYCGIITGEKTTIVSNRAKKLRLDFLYQGISEKRKVLHELLETYKITIDEVAYIGDDINDEPILKNIGFGACPSDAVNEIKSLAHYVCHAKGGEGCVREFAELILKHNEKLASS